MRRSGSFPLPPPRLLASRRPVRAARTQRFTGEGKEVGAAPRTATGCTRCERFLEFGTPRLHVVRSSTRRRHVTDCPTKNIDTGWGLERVARVVSDLASVFDTEDYSDNGVGRRGSTASRKGSRRVRRRSIACRRPRPRHEVHRPPRAWSTRTWDALWAAPRRRSASARRRSRHAVAV